MNWSARQGQDDPMNSVIPHRIPDVVSEALKPIINWPLPPFTEPHRHIIFMAACHSSLLQLSRNHMNGVFTRKNWRRRRTRRRSGLVVDVFCFTCNLIPLHHKDGGGGWGKAWLGGGKKGVIKTKLQFTLRSCSVCALAANLCKCTPTCNSEVSQLHFVLHFEHCISPRLQTRSHLTWLRSQQ